MSEDIIVKSQKLTKMYGHTAALKEADITIKRGSIYGLVGNNGAGKTTFLKILTGQIFPTEGSFCLMGAEDERKMQEVRKRIGAIIENPGFFPKLTAKQNLEYYRIQRGIPGKGIVDEMLKQVGLADAGKRKYENLSMGMKQRLGLGLALMGEPELLILDEPINGLDPIGIVEIRSFLSELSHNHGITIFISSHVLSEIEQIADIIGVMHEGHLVEEVNISELHKRNRKYIQFDLSDSEIAGKILENHYHMTDFTVQDGTVRIYDFSQSVGEINREFARNGLLVTRINDSEENLEDYFSKLIGGGGIA